MVISSLNTDHVRIELRNMDGSYVGTIGYTKRTPKSSGKAGKKKRRLPYNFKDISQQIMSSRTSGSARKALMAARAKVGALKKKNKSEDFDEKEIELALIHAQAMERVAKKKLRHLEQEEKAKPEDTSEIENEERDGERDGGADSLLVDDRGEDFAELSEETMRELMRQMEQLEKEMAESEEESLGMEELLSGGDLSDLRPENIEQLRKKHRSEEHREIVEADMKYLKALFQKYAREKASAGHGSSGGSDAVGNTGLSGSTAGTAGMSGGGTGYTPDQTVSAPIGTEGVNVDVTV